MDVFIYIYIYILPHVTGLLWCYMISLSIFKLIEQILHLAIYFWLANGLLVPMLFFISTKGAVHFDPQDGKIII